MNKNQENNITRDTIYCGYLTKLNSPINFKYDVLVKNQGILACNGLSYCFYIYYHAIGLNSIFTIS